MLFLVVFLCFLKILFPPCFGIPLQSIAFQSSVLVDALSLTFVSTEQGGENAPKCSAGTHSHHHNLKSNVVAVTVFVP